MHMFSDLEADDNRRPDILIRNPYGGGRFFSLRECPPGANQMEKMEKRGEDLIVIFNSLEIFQSYMIL